MTVQDVGVEPDDVDDRATGSTDEVRKNLATADDDDNDDGATPTPEPESKEDDADPPKPEKKTALTAEDRLKADVASERKKRKDAEAELRRIKSEGASEAEKATAAAVEAVETRYQGMLKKSAVQVALAEAGAKEVARLVKLVDLDALEVDDEGAVDGVSAEVDSLKQTYPELFTAEPGRRVPRVEPGGSGAKKVKSSAERLAEAMRGGE